MRSWFPFLGDRTVRRQLDRVFSRQMLGAALLSLTATKIVETALLLVAPRPPVRIVGWVVLFHVFLVGFAYWHRIEDAASDAAEAAADVGASKNEE